MSIKQVLARLSLAVLGLTSAGATEAAIADEAAALDQATLTETLQSAELAGWPRADRARLLRLIATDPRPPVRAEVARHLAELPAPLPPSALRTLVRLAADDADEVRDAVAGALAMIVDHAPGITSAGLLTRWALSPNTDQRRAVAAALERPVIAGLADIVLDHLASDPAPEVRRAVARAAWARRAAAPPLYQPVLDRLSDDPDNETREIARIALGRG